MIYIKFLIVCCPFLGLAERCDVDLLYSNTVIFLSSIVYALELKTKLRFLNSGG